MEGIELNDTNQRYVTNISSRSITSKDFEELKREFYINIIGCVATVFFAILTFLGNSAVVIIYFWDEKLHYQVGNILIVYLAATDISTSVFVMLPSAFALAMDFWPFGRFFCKTTAVFLYTFGCSSSYNIGLISLDRAIAVLQPFKYQTIVTKKAAICLCCTTSIYSFIFGLISNLPDYATYNYVEATCSIEYTSERGMFVILTGTMTCFFIPAIVVITCNILIMSAAKNSGKIAHAAFIRRYPETNKANTDNHMRKTIKSMIVLVCTFYFCFTPFVIFKGLAVADYKVPLWMNYIGTLFLYMSSSVNPFIYGILRKDFRNGFKKLPRLMSDKL